MAKNPKKPAASGKKPGRPAKKKPAAAKAAPAAAPVEPSGGPVRQLISENNLKTLLRRVESYKKQTDTTVGQLREEIANAVETKHLHKGAFAFIRKCRNMTPEKLSEFLDHVDHYLEVSGENDRADSVGRLPLNDGPGEDDDGDPDEGENVQGEVVEGADDKVSRPRFGGEAA